MGAVVIELHHQPARPLRAEIVLLPVRWLARALLARTLAAGVAMRFKDAFRHLLLVGHADGAGEVIAAAHVGGALGVTRVSLDLSGSASLRSGALVALRGVAATADDAAPRTAAILNALSMRPSDADGIAWAMSVALSSVGEGPSKPPRDGSELFAPISFSV